MKARTYTLLRESVTAGALGFLWNDIANPPKNQQEADRLAEKLTDRVMVEICEWFSFEDEGL